MKNNGPDKNEMSRILIVDDEKAICSFFKRLLAPTGYTIDTASNGEEAVARIQSTKYSAIISDIAMPKMDGITFLRAVREYDLDVPVILITGFPELQTAMQAIEFGAFRYLEKPIKSSRLIAEIHQAVLYHKLAKLKREALSLTGEDGWRLGDRASMEVRFQKGLTSLWMAFQPIVSWKKKSAFAFEALVRSDEPTLSNPLQLLRIAECLDQIHVLGESIRNHVVKAVPELPRTTLVFVNLHPRDLNDDALYATGSSFSKIAHQTVLEITERISLDHVKDVRSKVAFLRNIGFRIAIDDLGAGYAGLTSLAQLEPDFIKLDRTLISHVDTEKQKQRLIKSMMSLCKESGINVISEGIETVNERDTLIDLGCDLLQGYLFAKPSRGFAVPDFGVPLRPAKIKAHKSSILSSIARRKLNKKKNNYVFTND